MGKPRQQIPEDASRYVSERLAAVLPERLRQLLGEIARLCAKRGWAAYLVGGYVRDVLLGVPDYDVDVSIVGDAPEVASLLARSIGDRLDKHGRFGTATIALEGLPFDLDTVTARRETYERPGALPDVEPGSIDDDLARRDFTINSLAVPVVGDAFGRLLDPHGGLPDLRAGLIRVLHGASFRDDPTRILRAIRLAHRLDFAVEPQTMSLLSEAVSEGALSTVSTERLVHELLLVLETPGAGAIVADLQRLGILRGIHPELAWEFPAHRTPVEEPPGLAAPRRRDAYLAAVAAAVPGGAGRAERLARELRLDARDIRLMHDSAELAGRRRALESEHLRPSDIDALLSDVDERALRASLLLRWPEAGTGHELSASRIRQYLDVLRAIRPELTGNHLRALSVPPGPVYRELLTGLRRAKLDGLAPTRVDEERWLRDRLRERGLPAGEHQA